MNVFIDTAVRGCNIALFDDNKILAQSTEDIERGHAEILLPLYHSLITSLNASSDDVKSVYVNVGPGSFTGLRVGLTVARFIGFSLKIPVYGISSFQAFSSALENNSNRLILIETKRSDYYCQLFNHYHQAISKPQSISMLEVQNIIKENPNIMITGDAVRRYSTESECNKKLIFPQPTINVEKTIQAILDKKIIAMSAEAFYIRDADVSLPK